MGILNPGRTHIIENGGEYYLVTKPVPFSRTGLRDPRTGGKFTLPEGWVTVKIPDKLMRQSKPVPRIEDLEKEILESYGYKSIMLDFSQAVNVLLRMQNDDRVRDQGEEFLGDFFYKKNWKAGVYLDPEEPENVNLILQWDMIGRIKKIASGLIEKLDESENQDLKDAGGMEYLLLWEELDAAKCMHVALMLREYRGSKASAEQISQIYSNPNLVLGDSAVDRAYLRQVARLVRVSRQLPGNSAGDFDENREFFVR